jgi:hypothetical protein
MRHCFPPQGWAIFLPQIALFTWLNADVQIFARRRDISRPDAQEPREPTAPPPSGVRQFAPRMNPIWSRRRQIPPDPATTRYLFTLPLGPLGGSSAARGGPNRTETVHHDGGTLLIHRRNFYEIERRPPRPGESAPARQRRIHRSLRSSFRLTLDVRSWTFDVRGRRRGLPRHA